MLRLNLSVLFKNLFIVNFFVVRFFIIGIFLFIILVKFKEGLIFKFILFLSEM